MAGISAACAMVLACRSGGRVPGAPIPLPEGLRIAQEALDQTLPPAPVRIGFSYRIREADFRFSGRGVARVQPPYRVRLDLFSNGGEPLFQAALVGEDLRVPPWAPRELAPPAGLLWAAIGVFRPGDRWVLLGASRLGSREFLLRYRGAEGEELRFRAAGGRLLRAELHREGHLTEEVDLQVDERTGNVVRTVYRNLAMFLEMTFSLESMESVESFPPSIWDPGIGVG